VEHVAVAPAVRRLPAPLGWALCVALALGIGWLFRVPLLMTYLLGGELAAASGWAVGDPTTDDGLDVLAMTVAVCWLVTAPVAGGLTHLARRCTRLPARPWWWTAAALWVAPCAVLDLHFLLH
jgi:hypothetical protein